MAATWPKSISLRVPWKVQAALSRREGSLRKCAPMERDLGWVLGTLHFGDLDLICLISKGASRFLCVWKLLVVIQPAWGEDILTRTHSLPFLIVQMKTRCLKCGTL